MINEKDAAALRQYIERFTPLGDENWNLLLPHLQERKLSKHQLFARQGITAKEIGFLLEGSMRHFYLKAGEEKTTYFYFEHNFVSSYISCITYTPSLLSIEALTDCRMLVFSYSTLTALFQKSHAWEKFGRLIAEYLAIGLEERMVSLLISSPEERYRQLLQSNKHKILERIPQHYIASYLGITPVSLSRIRNRYKKPSA